MIYDALNDATLINAFNFRLQLLCRSRLLSSCSTGESYRSIDNRPVFIVTFFFFCKNAYYYIFSYQFTAANGFMIAFVWCLVVCLSRIYLGMHSVAVSDDLN